MTRQRLTNLFTLDATRSEGTPDNMSAQFRAPTLDERAAFYLRAVHEKDDFTREEYSQARDRILDAMAVDIAANLNVPEELTFHDALENTKDGSPEHRFDYALTTFFAAERSLKSGPDNELPSLSAPEASLARHGPARARTFASFDAVAVRTSESSPSRRMANASPSYMRVSRTISICASAAIAALATFFLIRVFPMDWFATGPHPQVAALPSPGESSDIKGDFAKPKLKQVETTAAPLAPIPALIDTDTFKKSVAETTTQTPTQPDLVKLGRELMATGDIRFARMVLTPAAEAGNAAAALELGSTYDPIVLEALKAKTYPQVVASSMAQSGAVSVLTVAPDLAMARTWYQKAKELGSAEASKRLERLPGAKR
jgi:hypothetical protein